MKLIENDPLDLEMLKKMLTAKEDLNLVWPSADYPFCPIQWSERLNPDRGSLSFWVMEEDSIIGHACLSPSTAPGRWTVNHLYLISDKRGDGRGKKILELLEEYARENLDARSLLLRVRDENLPAIRTSVAHGFTEIGRNDTHVKMSKALN
ncbi:GNAT family N-acetyltransferase [Aestuariispira insulae]|uniref:Acetyltransferase (GNAT) family protein n=1 Tax=Aestuariispira insulae TaxID=1461337 RepID=A0A3D9HWD7_9PROT|nr:GNAT family N-acetyltransferase [Aestuariispira insulae]RED53823.1 acetyltransferase (GNAT) family protein [Aestuariispira insulae]